MKKTKLISLIMAVVMLLAVGNMSVFAQENDVANSEIINVSDTEVSTRERPDNAKLVGTINLEIDQNGDLINYTSTDSGGIARSHTGPMSITLSPSGNWISGAWRDFDGRYIGYDVTAKYSNGNTSNFAGLLVYMEAYSSIGNNGLRTYAVPLDGVNHKCDDWRQILGTPTYKFVYKNNTWDLADYKGSITVQIQAYSWS
mgnify:CR=1 FL=1